MTSVPSPPKPPDIDLDPSVSLDDVLRKLLDAKPVHRKASEPKPEAPGKPPSE